MPPTYTLSVLRSPPQSAAAAAKGPKGTPSPGGFDDSTLPLVDKSLGEYGVGVCTRIPEVHEMLLHLGALLVTRQVRGRGALSWLAASYSLSTHSVHMDVKWQGGVSGRGPAGWCKDVSDAGYTGSRRPACYGFVPVSLLVLATSQPPGLCLADGEKTGSRDVIPMEALGPGEC